MTETIRMGFAGFQDGTFELILVNPRTGKETMLCGQLKPGQLAVVDAILPTCVFITVEPAALSADKGAD